jgi:hypothetical protein
VAVVHKFVHRSRINKYVNEEKQYKKYKNTGHTKYKAEHTEQENKHEMNNKRHK